jgi:hypothetical protein
MDKTVRWGVFWLAVTLAASTLLLVSSALATPPARIAGQTKGGYDNSEVMLRNDAVESLILTPSAISVIAR